LKKKFFSIVLVGFGAALWATLSTTAHQSIKKWDGKFAAVLRQNLTQAGLSNDDIVSSVNQAHNSNDGPWTTQVLELKKMTPEKAASLKKALEDAGAHVDEVNIDGKRMLQVKRGHRLYQKITYSLPS